MMDFVLQIPKAAADITLKERFKCKLEPIKEDAS